MGVKGMGNGGSGVRGKRGQEMGEEGAGVGNFWGGGYTKICCILLILFYFYVLQCNKWVSEVSNRHIEVNSGIQ